MKFKWLYIIPVYIISLIINLIKLCFFVVILPIIVIGILVKEKASRRKEAFLKKTKPIQSKSIDQSEECAS